MSAQCGDFATAIWHSDSSVEFHTDYVGASAWFEYRSDTVRIIASNYLLAVSIALALGEPLELNLNTIDVDFTSLTQAFQQPLLDDLELAGFACLRPDTVLSITPDGTEVREPSVLGQDISAPDRFTVARYNELLNKASEELVSHCSSIAEDPDINFIRCDISGGLDSRLVLAGFLAGKPQYLSKLSLYTESPSNAPSSGDVEIAALVSATTGLCFSDRTIELVGPCSVPGLANHQLSASFGVYWHRGHTHANRWDPHTVHIGGAGLDNFARDYTTESWKLSSRPVSAPQEVSVSLAKQLFKWRGRASLKAAPQTGISGIAATWNDVPGDEVDKGAQLFNFFRARFHGGASVPAALGAFRMSPGPTRSLYKLRLMTSRTLDGPRAQIEILHKLNPSLAAVPFVSARYNETYAALYGPTPHASTPDLTQLNTARATRHSSQRWVPCPECEPPAVGLDRSGTLIDFAKRALHDLGNDPLLHEMMLPAFRFATEHLGPTFDMNDSYGKTFVNKILHLHAAWSMTKRPGVSNGR